MKRHIPIVLLLAVVLCLSSCAGRPDLREETTMSEIDSSEPMLFLTNEVYNRLQVDAMLRMPRFGHL